MAKIVASNAAIHKDHFITQVNMWVYEELVGGRQLTSIINQDHENVKYSTVLPLHSRCCVASQSRSRDSKNLGGVGKRDRLW